MTLRDQFSRSLRGSIGRRLFVRPLALITAMTMGLSGTPAAAGPPKPPQDEDGDILESPKPALPTPKKDDKAKPIGRPNPRTPRAPATDTELTGDESGVAYNSCKRQPPGRSSASPCPRRRSSKTSSTG